MKFFKKMSRKDFLMICVLFLVWGYLLLSPKTQEIFSEWGEADSLSEQKLVSYQIQGNVINSLEVYEINKENKKLIRQQENDQKHLEIWDYFQRLIPEQYREDLVGFDISTDGYGGTWAEVYQSYDDPQKWVVAIDPEDFYWQDEIYLEDLLATIIHEIGHIVSLNSSQVDLDNDLYYLWQDGSSWRYWSRYDDLEFDCPNYFPGEGCAKDDSYINQFYQEFWLDKYEENLEIWEILDDEEFEDQIWDFYKKYEDEFVNDYAAYNPAEDFAESFMYFVLEYSDYEENSEVIQEKINFFYQFPELVEMKEEIFENYWEIWDSE